MLRQLGTKLLIFWYSMAISHATEHAKLSKPGLRFSSVEARSRYAIARIECMPKDTMVTVDSPLTILFRRPLTKCGGLARRRLQFERMLRIRKDGQSDEIICLHLRRCPPVTAFSQALRQYW